MGRKKIKYSIIVPVYNVEQYIERCINSIIAQTEKNWELILINDGSQDHSGEICKHFSSIDSRITYLHNTSNKGVSTARNEGLNIATGEWITFIDSDDWIEPFHLEEFNKQINKGTDLCINSFIADLSYGPRPFIYPSSLSNNQNDTFDLFFGALNAHSQFLWIKAFKASIIKNNNLRFDQTVNLGEDNIFILNYLPHIKSISSCSKASYHYDQINENPNSLGRKKRSIKDANYQIEQNTQAIYKLYELTGKEYLLKNASNYYYTRIFERIFIPNTIICYGIFRKPFFNENFIFHNKKLNIKYINNKLIRQYWFYHNNPFKALVIFNYYLINKWLISKITKIVVAAKHVAKSVLKHV